MTVKKDVSSKKQGTDCYKKTKVEAWERLEVTRKIDLIDLISN